MSRYIGYIVLLISICASGAFARSLKCYQPVCPGVDHGSNTQSVLLPYPYDCGKFIICDNGVQQIANCQPGLHFNPSKLQCDWPVDAGCEICETETTETPVTEAPTTTEAPITEAPTTEAPTTQAPTTEAPTTEAPTTEAPTTEAPTTEAPTTEVPTTEALTTEAPTTEAPTTEAPTTEAPTTEAPTTEEPTTEAQATTTQVPEATCEIADCPELAENRFLFLAVPWDCSKYVMCLNNHIYDMNCAPGLIFSDEVQNCVIPSETDVCDPCELEVQTTTVEPEVETPPPCKVEECSRSQNTPLYLAVPWDCSKLILCIRGQTFEQSCSAGLIFSSAEQNCVLPENTVCEVCDQATEAPDTEAPETEAPTTEAPATEAPETEVPTTEAPATEAPTTEAPATEAPTTEAPATEAPTTEAPATEAPETTEAATEAPEVPEKCTTGNPSCSIIAWDVLSPVPWNCSQYFNCNWGSLTIKNCPENTYFNASTKTCVGVAESNCVACIQ